MAVVVTAALFVYLSSLRPAAASPEPLLRVIDDYMGQRISLGPSESGYYVLNSGSSPVAVEYLVLRDSKGLITLARAGRGTPCSVGGTVIPPGGLSVVNCGGGFTLVAVVTAEGRVFVRDPRLAMPYLVQRAIPQRLLLTPEVASKLENYVEEVSKVRVNSSLGLVKMFDVSGDGVRVRIEANASLVIALRSSASPDRWNVLVVGYGAHSRRSYSWAEVGEEGPVNLSRVGALRFRVKIENLSSEGGFLVVGSRSITSPGIIPCLVNEGKQCWVRVSGEAGRIAIYVNGTSPSANADLYPYYITGDLDGNGYPEFLLVTQDFGVGNRASVNDREVTRAGVATVVDSTREPVRIVFTDAPINNTRYAVAIVSMRLLFWDSSLDDISDNDNRVLVRVGVYDPDSKRYLYHVSLSYYELCRYRTVSPMTLSYVIKDFILYIPSPEEVGSKTLFVAVDLADPYSNEGTRNDTEIILGVEYIAVVLGVRL